VWPTTGDDRHGPAAGDGVLYGGNTTKRNEANNVCSALNNAGGIR
jgi:hypothetical protein